MVRQLSQFVGWAGGSGLGGTFDPVEAIKFRMEQSGLSVKDLEPIIGKSDRVYEVLNRKRPLTLAPIRRLHSVRGIPAEVSIAGS